MAYPTSVNETEDLLPKLAREIQERSGDLKFALLLIQPGTPDKVVHVTDASPEDAVQSLRAVADGIEKQAIEATKTAG